VAGGKQLIYTSRSTDRGTTWTTPVVLSTSGEESTEPMIESRGSGDVRMAWAQTVGRRQRRRLEPVVRKSTDGGATWSTAVRISDATSGAPYKSAAGYAEVYGDYGEMAITSAGKTIATWVRASATPVPAASGSIGSAERSQQACRVERYQVEPHPRGDPAAGGGVRPVDARRSRPFGAKTRPAVRRPRLPRRAG